jgi:hypothetical protein
MEVRTPYNYDRDEVSKNTALLCPEETLAQQNMKDEADLNIMIRKFNVLPVQQVNWQEFDATVIPSDFHQLKNMMLEAEDAYASLPADIRKATDNDPEKFLTMVDAKRAEIKKQEKASKQQAKEEAEVSEGNEADKPAE